MKKQRRDYIDAVSADAADDDADEAGIEAGAPRCLQVEAPFNGQRVDKVLAQWLSDVSRSRIQQWIEAGAVRVNGAAPRARDPVFEGDVVEVEPLAAPEAAAFAPEPLALDIVYEDDAIIVLDKPAGLVVHPAAGHWSGTLLNGLLAHDASLAHVPRAGIVHRLDADTSGLMVVARTEPSHFALVRQLQDRTVTREYWAVVAGSTPPGGSIDAPIARDARNPLRFRVSHTPAAKPARTLYRRVATAVPGPAAQQFSWVACRLQTGRTHQIRVHMESIGHPLVGDPVYRRGLPSSGLRGNEQPVWARFKRQALHACRLALMHPTRNEPMQWFRPPPADLRDLMMSLGWRVPAKPIEVFQ